MPASDDGRTIEVVAEWNGWRTADVLVSDLENVHWFQPVGAPRPLLHAYALCTQLKAGELGHDCGLERAEGPHRLRLCILKSHTPSSTYRELAARADEATVASYLASKKFSSAPRSAPTG
jgi:hypothetical protein